jgi:hypothetical protein
MPKAGGSKNCTVVALSSAPPLSPLHLKSCFLQTSMPLSGSILAGTGYPSSAPATLRAKAGPRAGAPSSTAFRFSAHCKHLIASSGPFNRSWERRWKRILKPYGCPPHGIYRLRHTGAHSPPPPPPSPPLPPCRSESFPSLNPSGSAAATGINQSSRGLVGSSGRLDSSPPIRSHSGSSAPYAESLYANPSCGRSGGDSGSFGSSSKESISISVPVMEQKLAELLLLSNSPDIDAGRVMAAAGMADELCGNST